MPRTINVLIILSALIMAFIWLMGPYSAHIDFIPDQGPTWYFWKLPDADFITRLSAWGSFVAHQVFFWWLIWDGKCKKQRGEIQYSNGLQRHNYIALFGNLFFIIWHVVQTKLFYDGLAQDTHVFSGQFAVIILLSLVLVLENQRRGLIFGKSIGWINHVRYLVKEYHGYYFSWAIVYTFWFHPIEINAGHMLGTFYAIMIMVQGCLIYTRYHQNRNWTVLLETFVLIHGAIVAWLSVYHNIWPMFAFGFATMFMVTGIYGLGLQRSTIRLLTLLYIAIVIFFYRHDLTAIQEVVRIPFILILVAIVLAAMIYPFARKPTKPAPEAKQKTSA
ncbi:hypothetical protein [Thalassotalea sp. HSM 43]|uniref:hypothetical protein n=1 Tax=Thalassotalea sp. HSM 43 TaxID=2552945 RepID=UPI00167A7A0E|nr:hypothetical protein [Thalassotalea sp. HSM 43]